MILRLYTEQVKLFGFCVPNPMYLFPATKINLYSRRTISRKDSQNCREPGDYANITLSQSSSTGIQQQHPAIKCDNQSFLQLSPYMQQ